MSQARIDFLSKEVIRHRRLYYNGKPEISDPAFDFLYQELKELDPTNYAITGIGAPVEENSEWLKANHEMPMGSLDKVLTPEELVDWINGTLKDHNSVFITEKLDGASIEVIYDKGNLVQAITRGDGTVGEDITRNVVKMLGVKTKLDKFTGSLRGEIILTKSDMEKYFPDSANSRNAASGIAKRLDGLGCEHLNVLFYQVLSEVDFKDEVAQFRFLENFLGVNVPPYAYFIGNKEKICQSIIEYWEDYHKARDSKNYEIDGLVVRVNELSDQIELGDKDMRPKGAVAFKFRSERAKTKVVNIPCQTGNSGRITPVGEVEMVELVGAHITRASLYNFGYIKELGIDIGAEVIICRAGDVIPRIEEVVIGTGTIFQPPVECPSCGGRTKMYGENLMCINTDTCPAQKVGRVKNWINSLNILEWGETMLERLVETEKVSNIVDLYKLSVEDLASLERMGDKSAKKCFEILWNHNPIPLELFIGSLSIPMIGSSTIKLIADAGFDSLDKILAASKEDFSNIKGLGPVKSESLFVGLKRNKEIISGLLSVGIKIKPKIFGSLSGKSFCFTGTMKNKRKILEDIVVKNGGSNKSVGKELNFLVIDDVASTKSKAVAARKLGIKFISEDDFLEMIDNEV
jgi:DNA ligase (NAD+)